jgi:hypothetical protein
MGISLRPAVVALALLSFCALSPIATAAAPPDAGLYTLYEFSTGYTDVSFLVCGSVPGSDGCYGSGSMGPFGHVGAMSEGDAHIVGDMINRDVYIVDVAGGTSGSEVLLYRYELTNAVNPPNDTVSIKQTGKIALPLIGGANVRCSLAGNSAFLFIGTDQSTSAVRVTKKGSALQETGGFSNNPTVAAITVDDRGFIIVTFGANAGLPGGQITFGPDGNAVGDGGGASFTLPSGQGISTKDLPTYL